MVANKNKLLGKIAENGYTRKAFAEAMGMSVQSLALKIKSKAYEFTIGESLKAKEILHLSVDEYLDIFINF